MHVVLEAIESGGRSFQAFEQHWERATLLMQSADPERRLAQPFHIAGQERVVGKIDRAVVGERRALRGGFARILLQMDVAAEAPSLAATEGSAWVSFFRSRLDPCQNSE